MNLCLIDNDFRYELEKLIGIFLPFEKIKVFNKEVICENTAVCSLSGEYATSKLIFGGKEYNCTEKIDLTADDLSKEKEIKLAKTLYYCFTKALAYYPEWGILTGIRPAKLFAKIGSSKGVGVCEYFKNEFLVSDKKIALCKETSKSEEKIVSLSKSNSFSLYVSIPFCPTRCSYCSFISHSVESAKRIIPDYILHLCREIEETGKIAKYLKLNLETVYIGGGTPTVLTAEQIKTVMTAVNNSFDLKNIREYTVEAGRPDTIDEEKLKVIKEFGATRISINPQTMNDSVLEAIGRKHTAKQTEDAFDLARKAGFSNINMDLIAGLPTDNFESFKSTISRVLKLNPESVTVHSLAMKRSSRLTQKGELPEIESGITASYMVDYAHSALSGAGLLPYYMYRQSKTVGNLENVGYAKKGYEGLYNVFIMDETHTILACGASAVTKLKAPCGDLIERIFNYKYPFEYVGGFNEMLARKKGVLEFYGKYGNRD